jgi:hypothetical protein
MMPTVSIEVATMAGKAEERAVEMERGEERGEKLLHTFCFDLISRRNF